MARKSSRNAMYVAALRTACWVVVALAVVQAGRNPGPGGPELGLVLAGTLAIILGATRNGGYPTKGQPR